MSKILKTHPKSVQSHKDLILQCLDDKDESIRLRALDLLYGMVCVPVPRTRALAASAPGSAGGTCPGCREWGLRQPPLVRHMLTPARGGCCLGKKPALLAS